jgi:hypothetical protein
MIENDQKMSLNKSDCKGEKGKYKYLTSNFRKRIRQ